MFSLGTEVAKETATACAEKLEVGVAEGGWASDMLDL
jgi:hypothetical protein